MKNNLEVKDPQNNPIDNVTLPKEELDAIKHRAEVSSQNFERAKKAEAEAKALREEIDRLQNNSFDDDDGGSTDSKAFRGEIAGLTQKLSSIEDRLTMERIQSQYPVLRERSQDFEEFRQDYPNIALEKIVPFYLREKGLVPDTHTTRDGLERSRGGGQTPQSSRLDIDEVRRLRENEPKKYIQLIRSGKIKSDDMA